MFPTPSPELEKVINKLTSVDLIDPNPLKTFKVYGARIQNRLKDDMSLIRPLYPDFESFDYLHDISSSTPIYLNDYDLNIEEDRDRLAELTRLEFNGNTFQNVAECSPGCRTLRGNHLVGSNIVCPKCGNKVEMYYDKNTEVSMWLKCPEGVDTFINHGFYNTFFTSIIIAKQGAPRLIVARYFIDPSYRKEFKAKHAVTEIIMKEIMEELNIQDVGINSFYHNCDKLMQYLIMGPGNKFTGLKEQTADAWEFWERYKSKAFCKYIKVPSRYSTILEHNDRGTWGVEGQIETKQIYYAIAGCKKSSEYYELTERDKKSNQNLVGRKIIELTDMYIRKINNRSIFHKKAISRKHVCSGSLPVTGRRVITSETGLLDPNQMMIPWKLAISTLTVHITNMLYRKGVTPLKAMQRLNVAAYHIDPDIDAFLTRIEQEKKLLVESHRNPSNEYLSIKSFFGIVNRVLSDESLKISILACASYNADFDGDQMPVRVHLDNESKAKAYGSFGHHQTLDKNVPFRVSNLAAMPATHMMNLNMFFNAIKPELDGEYEQQ